jgi:hypothetical protein
MPGRWMGRSLSMVVGFLMVLGVAAGAPAADSIPRLVSATPAPGARGLVETEKAPEVVGPAIDYYVKAYDVSRAEAVRRLTLQVKSLGDLNALRAAVGDRGRLRFDNERGRLVVDAVGDDVVQAAQAEFERLGYAPDEYAVEPARHTLAELEDGLDATREALADTLASGQISLGIEDGGVLVAPTRELPPDTAAHVRRVARDVGAQQGVPVTVKAESSPTPSTTACSNPYCDQAVGGVKWGPIGCSLGFYAGVAPSGGGSYFLTAGHCIAGLLTPNVSRWWTCNTGGVSCGVGGYVISGYYNGLDSGALQVDSFAFGLYPGWVNWWNNGVTHLVASANPIVGYTICHNGYASGSVGFSPCGTVTDTNWAFTQGTTPLSGMTKVQGMCANGGDSGGPVTYASWAYAAGLENGGFTCPNSVDNGAVEPIARALSATATVLYG